MGVSQTDGYGAADVTPGCAGPFLIQSATYIDSPICRDVVCAKVVVSVFPAAHRPRTSTPLSVQRTTTMNAASISLGTL